MAAFSIPPPPAIEFARRNREIIRQEMEEEERLRAQPPEPVDYDLVYAEFNDLLRPLARIPDGIGAAFRRRRMIDEILGPLRQIGERVAASVKEGHSSTLEMLEAMSCLYGMIQRLTGLKKVVFNILRPRGSQWPRIAVAEEAVAPGILVCENGGGCVYL
jgi:hypothetical protein